MASIGELVISLRADIASFRSGMDEAKKKLDDIKEHSSAAASALQSFQRYADGLISVVAVERLASFSLGLVEAAARLSETSRAMGVNVEVFQAQQLAARAAGVSGTEFATSMERLQRNLDLLATNGVTARDVFVKLGLSATNADGTLRSASDTLQDLAQNKVFQAETHAQKLADVMVILGGRSASASLIVNALNGKLADLSKFMADAKDKGLILSKETADGAEKMWLAYDEFFTRLKNRWTEWLVYTYQHPLSGLSHGPLDVPDPAQGGATGDWSKTPPGPPIQPKAGGADKAKQLQNFSDEYAKMLETYQEDLNYQSRLREAYQQSADAVRKLAVEHAGEAAAAKAIALAARDRVAISTQEIDAIRGVAAASKQATLAADEQKQVSDALAKQKEQYAAKVQQVLDATDGLTKKNNELAETLGILEQTYQRGIIPTLAEYQQRVQAAEQAAAGLGADNKGMKEFTSGLSSGLDGLLGKLTDVNAMVQESHKKGGQSIFQQLNKDAQDSLASLEKLIFKLAIINPMLNSLGLGDQGAGKQLPTLGGASGLLGWLAGLFGGASGGVPTNLSGNPAMNGPGFANGGEFVVGGIGGTDSQLVSFNATPGEKVAVGANAGSGGDARRGGDIKITMNNSGLHADTFRANRHQIAGDLIRAIGASRRYA
jgi:hypothetical protein